MNSFIIMLKFEGNILVFYWYEFLKNLSIYSDKSLPMFKWVIFMLLRLASFIIRLKVGLDSNIEGIERCEDWVYKKWANCWIHSRTFFPDAFLDGSRYLLCSHSRLSKLDSSTSPYIILNTMESSTAVGRYTESKERVRFTRVNFILKDRHLITFIGYRRPGFFTIRIKWVDKKASLQNIRQAHAGRWWRCRNTTNEYGFCIRLSDRNTQFTVGCNIFV